jgi:excisionase family DNA binding protein
MTTMTNESLDTRLMTPAEVAAVFRVDVKTVTRWANAGKLTSIRTLGGHRRFRESEVMALMQGTLVSGPIPAQSRAS